MTFPEGVVNKIDNILAQYAKDWFWMGNAKGGNMITIDLKSKEEVTQEILAIISEWLNAR